MDMCLKVVATFVAGRSHIFHEFVCTAFQYVDVPLQRVVLVYQTFQTHRSVLDAAFGLASSA